MIIILLKILTPKIIFLLFTVRHRRKFHMRGRVEESTMRLPPVLYSQQARTVNILPVTCYVIFGEHFFLKGIFSLSLQERLKTHLLSAEY